MAFSCCCANPDCMVNGCARARQVKLQPTITGTTSFTLKPPTKPPTKPLTEDDIRRIIREELKRG